MKFSAKRKVIFGSFVWSKVIPFILKDQNRVQYYCDAGIYVFCSGTLVTLLAVFLWYFMYSCRSDMAGTVWVQRQAQEEGRAREKISARMKLTLG